MAIMPKKAELRIKQGQDRPLSKLYINEEEFPYYCVVGGVSFRPSTQLAGLNEVTVTFLVEGPVDITVVDKATEL